MPGFSRMMGDDDDPTACFAMHPSRADLTLPLVAPGRDGGRRDRRCKRGSTALHGDVAAGRPPEHDFSAALPLLRQMLAWSAEQAVGSG